MFKPLNIIHAIYIHCLLHDLGGEYREMFILRIDSISSTERRDNMEAKNKILPFTA